jgi:hypothetical protein
MPLFFLVFLGTAAFFRFIDGPLAQRKGVVADAAPAVDECQVRARIRGRSDDCQISMDGRGLWRNGRAKFSREQLSEASPRLWNRAMARQSILAVDVLLRRFSGPHAAEIRPHLSAKTLPLADPRDR